MMKPKFELILLFITLFRGEEINGLRCYVCSDDSSLPCLNFDTEKEKYIQQCDQSENGCFLKIDGNNKTRSCDEKKIDDCKMANGVEYCFCSTDICNGNNENFPGYTDDEDLIEGSGTKIVTDTNENVDNKHKSVEIKPAQNATVTIIPSLGNVNCQSYLNLTFLFLFLLLMV